MVEFEQTKVTGISNECYDNETGDRLITITIEDKKKKKYKLGFLLNNVVEQMRYARVKDYLEVFCLEDMIGKKVSVWIADEKINAVKQPKSDIALLLTGDEIKEIPIDELL